MHKFCCQIIMFPYALLCLVSENFEDYENIKCSGCCFAFSTLTAQNFVLRFIRCEFQMILLVSVVDVPAVYP